MTRMLLIVSACLFVSNAHADDAPAQATPPAAAESRPIETRTFEYEKDGITFRGYLAKPADLTDEVPGILVVHEWWGLNDFAKQQTRRLAELGYVAFAADMYGEGRTTTDPQQAGQWASQVLNDRSIARKRAEEALDVLEDVDEVDDDKLGVIGYCFGGTVAVELGYEEDDVEVVVSFHGNPMPARERDDDVEARFLILHGTADTLVPEERLTAFSNALDAKGVQYRIIRYDGAKHSFTNPAADALGMEGVGFDEYAARRSWSHMRETFDEVFGSKH